MAWGNALIVVALDVAVGNAAAVALSREPRDAHIFDDARALARIDGQPTTARVICVQASDRAVSQSEEFSSGGYPSVLTDAGMTHEQIDAIRSVLFCETCAVDDLATVYPTFLSSLGYEP